MVRVSPPPASSARTTRLSPIALIASACWLSSASISPTSGGSRSPQSLSMSWPNPTTPVRGTRRVWLTPAKNSSLRRARDSIWDRRARANRRTARVEDRRGQRRVQERHDQGVNLELQHQKGDRSRGGIQQDRHQRLGIAPP